jgi:hypothetical protein
MMVVEVDKTPRRTSWDKLVSSLQNSKTPAMPDVEQRQIQVERKNKTPRELRPYTDHNETTTRNKNPKAEEILRETHIHRDRESARKRRAHKLWLLSYCGFVTKARMIALILMKKANHCTKI